MVRPIVQIRPNVCTSCDVGYAALEYTLQEAIRLGYDITDLGSSLATKEDLELVIAEKAPLFLNGFGHGNVNVFTGQNTIPVITKGVNEEILSGMITYLLSCLTGVELGPAIIAAGGWAYIGYTVSWTWMDEDGAGDPFQDKYAIGFYDGSNVIPIAIMNGLVAQNAKQVGYDKYTEWIDYWAASDDPYAADCIQWLLYDRDSCILLGDPGASLELPIPPKWIDLKSEPIRGVTILVDEVEYVTPATSIALEEGIHVFAAPPSITVDGAMYTFLRWEDGTTTPTRTISVTSDMTIIAYFTGAGATPVSFKLKPGIHKISVPEVVVV